MSENVLRRKSVDWFLYERDLPHERVKECSGSGKYVDGGRSHIGAYVEIKEEVKLKLFKKLPMCYLDGF